MINTVMKPLVLLTIFFLSFIYGCRYDGSSGSSGVIIPLKAGNTWIYEESVTDSLGRLRDMKLDTSSVGLSTSIDGLQWFFFTGPGNSPSEAMLSTNKNDGFWIHNIGGSESLLLLPYPFPEGAEIILGTDTSLFDSTISQFKIKVISNNEPIFTTIGTFFCYHYSSRTDQIDLITHKLKQTDRGDDIFAAPNIGIVKISNPVEDIIFDSIGVKTITETRNTVLIDYTLK
jgi:hypothetical protein